MIGLDLSRNKKRTEKSSFTTKNVIITIIRQKCRSQKRQADRKARRTKKSRKKEKS